MAPLAAVPDLDRELAALYGLPLDAFTKARNDLAARLRRAHQSDAAAEVRGLRKPTVVAWAANQLARSETELVRRLTDTGAELREAQQRALAGEADARTVAEATAAEREAIRALVVAGRALLGERASPGLLDRLTQTLRAAAIDEQAGPLLAAGRLTEELQAVGFGPLEAVEPKRRDADEVRRAARDHVNHLRAEARRLAGEAREAEDAAAEAERAVQELRSAALAKREEAERIAAELGAAEDDLRSRR
ncbi:MAG TPA: hypothetical protein VHC01_10125 [Gaiellaceae bacterium]|jgi:hypothetical protein|nr:hypothetical protein [Gaiellaceae bacterium]